MHFGETQIKEFTPVWSTVFGNPLDSIVIQGSRQPVSEAVFTHRISKKPNEWT